MPMIYGEGERAFRRLQEEIIKRSNDLTIFAWSAPDHYEKVNKRHDIGMFAKSPDAFKGMGDIVPFANDFTEFTITNKRILFRGDLPIRRITLKGSPVQTLYGLYVGSRQDRVGIFLRKIGPHIYQRCGWLPLLGSGKTHPRVKETGFMQSSKSNYIIADPSAHTDALVESFRTDAMHVPQDDTWDLPRVAPEALWDATDRVFLRPSIYAWNRYPTALACKFRKRGSDSEIVVYCVYQSESIKPLLKVLEADNFAASALSDPFSLSNSGELKVLDSLELSAHEDIVDVKSFDGEEHRSTRT